MLQPNLSYRETIGFHKRGKLFKLLLAIVFLLLTVRLFHLQIIKGNYYQEMAKRNSLRLLSLPALRGSIYDRSGVPLASNSPSFHLTLIPAEMKEPEETLRQLACLVDLSPETMMDLVNSSQHCLPFQHLLVKKSLSLEEVIAIEENHLDLPGISLETKPRRLYPYGEIASVLLGHLGEVDEKQVWSQGYKPGQLVGKMGLERYFEDFLRGKDGGMQVQVYSLGQIQLATDSLGEPRLMGDSLGRHLKILGQNPPSPGNDIVITIHKDFQQLAEQALGEKKGSIVLMDAQDGEILAMVSKPGFDPNLWVWYESREDLTELLKSPHAPFLNRSISAYSPGSIFKIVLALAGLEKGVVNARSTFFCPGFYELGNQTFRCWKEGGHGLVNLQEALAFSCDVYFYRLGLLLGPETIAQYSQELGLGQKTELPLPFESGGLVPDPIWKKKTFGSSWLAGETLMFSIGQGYVQVTPLQMARLMACIVNGGYLVRPILLKAITNRKGQPLFESKPEREQRPFTQSKSLDIIKESLRKTVLIGTGTRAKAEGLHLLGKTGTAQLVSQRKGQGVLPPHLRDHAWFIGALLNHEPPLVVAILVENGGKGGQVAAPLAREIFLGILSREQKDRGDYDLAKVG